MSIYRGAGGAGDATADSASEALLIRELAVEVQADADAASISATNSSNSASASATSATNASNSATAAATSATNASNSASAAATSATNSANSATAAQTAETAAELAETNAETAQAAAELAETNAETAAATATTQAGIATTQAGIATTQATNAATSATSAGTSATNAAASAAAAAASYDSFDDRYLGVKTANPTLDNDGNALVTGALYYNDGTVTPADKGMKVYDGAQWIAASAASTAILTVYRYTATAGQTTFSGADDNALTLSYTAGSAIVTVNGAVMEIGTDVTATTGTSIVLAQAALLNDEVNIYAFATFNIANTYTQAQVDAFAVKLTGDQTIAGVKTFSSPVTTSAGTVSAPAITTTGDTNTGIFFPAADTIAFTEGGVEAMRIDSSANVGIGTSSPASLLNLSSATNTTLTISGSSGGGGDVSQIDFFRIGSNITSSIKAIRDGGNTSGALTFLTAASGTNTERMRIDSSGNVGIGTSTPLSTGANRVVMTVNGSSSAIVNLGVNGTETSQYYADANAVVLGSNTNIPFILRTNLTERMRIDSSGNLLVGTTAVPAAGNNGISVYTAGQPIIRVARSGTGNQDHMQFMNANGIVGSISTSGSATTYSTSSDYRLKENIAPMTGALAKVSQLNPVTYQWKVDGSSGEGFIAHELQAVVPDCVTGEKDATRIEQYEITPAIPATFDEEGNELTPVVEAVMGEHEVPVYQGIDTSFLVATLTAAIQELKTELDSVKAELQVLKGTI